MSLDRHDTPRFARVGPTRVWPALIALGIAVACTPLTARAQDAPRGIVLRIHPRVGDTL